MTERRKIPSACACCRQELSRSDMEFWILAAEREGKDPVAAAFETDPPGATCCACFRSALAEAYADGHPVARGIVARLVIEQRGGRVIDGGKK